ncbi:MAG: AAA family ATPase [Candidatus Rokubacteria bacterium]|nr:AAA family ATPase [Candidatus Rokubacteria bacterium]
MYEAFYGLREKPFSLTPDPKFFYLSQSHRDALDHLLYGIQQREGFIVITGDVGTGKTTLCRALLGKLDERTKTALIFNPMLSQEELLRSILQDFGLRGAGATKKELIDELNEFLIRLLTEGRNAVLIVDEAQDLSEQILEQIRLLSNLETEKEKLIQIILVGQLGLLDLLSAPGLKQLNQRVSVRFKIRPLSPHETNQYIFHRLLVAGSTGEAIFSPAALQAIYRYSQGVPRLVNLACDRALLQGFVDQDSRITAERVNLALKSLDQEVGMGPAGFTPRRSASRAAQLVLVAMLVLVAGFAGGWLSARGWLSASQPGAPGSVPPRQEAASEDTPAGSPFTVFVSSHRTEAEARDAERQLQQRGYDPFTAVRAGSAGERSYWVFAGRFRDLEGANRTRERLARQDGYSETQIMRVAEAVKKEQ